MNHYLPMMDKLFSKEGLIIAVTVFFWSLLSTLDVLKGWMKFDRGLIDAGEYWRIITCHFVHVDIKHGLLNGLAVLFFLYIFKSLRPVDWVLLTLISSLLISTALFFLNPDILWYVGFSGVLHACFTAGSLAMIFNGEKVLGGTLLILLLIKLIWEQYSGPTLLSGDALVITVAHLYGAISGLMYAALFFHTTRKLPKQ